MTKVTICSFTKLFKFLSSDSDNTCSICCLTFPKGVVAPLFCKNKKSIKFKGGPLGGPLKYLLFKSVIILLHAFGSIG